MNYDDSLLVWQWINNISEFNNNLSIIKDSIISFVISNYANRESYFKEEIKRIVVNVMYRYKIFEDDNSRDIYNNYLLWASDDYLELISYYSDSIDLFDSEQFHICLRIIRENDKWSTINKTIAKNKAYYEDCLIHEIFKKEDIEYIYLNTKLILDWTKIITEVVRNVAIKENREIAIKLNALNKDILAHVDELKIKKEVSPFLQNLLADAVDMKLLALDLIDKYRYPINDKSDMFFSIKSDFVDICDVNTGIKNLEKLKRWLKSHRLTPKSGINERLKIIMKTANSSLKTDLQALIKY